MIGSNDILIGRIVEVNIEDIYLTVTLPDIKKVDKPYTIKILSDTVQSLIAAKSG